MDANGPDSDPINGDGEYPSQLELNRIKAWPMTDLLGLFKYIGKRWRYPDRFDIGTSAVGNLVIVQASTGGWSGNEDLIGALQDNRAAWLISWQESRRGGHYLFNFREARNVHD